MTYNGDYMYQLADCLFYRVVKKSSYRLNSIILIAVLVGFTGTLLFAIDLDSDVSPTASTAICNVR